MSTPLWQDTHFLTFLCILLGILCILVGYMISRLTSSQTSAIPDNEEIRQPAPPQDLSMPDDEEIRQPASPQASSKSDYNEESTLEKASGLYHEP